jgi:hypothetical protein
LVYAFVLAVVGTGYISSMIICGIEKARQKRIHEKRVKKLIEYEVRKARQKHKERKRLAREHQQWRHENPEKAAEEDRWNNLTEAGQKRELYEPLQCERDKAPDR